MSRRVVSVTLVEARTKQGWPRCLVFQFAEGWPLEVELAEQREYSSVAEAVESINASLERAARS